jgi:hypothetical protein
MIEKSSPEFAELLGEAICALSRHFVGVAIDARPAPGKVINGRDKLDPVYVAVTEHRDGPGPLQRANYSSCGDQLHAILERLGVRLPFVNRKSLHGRFAYGENITWLQKPACLFAAEAKPHEPPPPAGSLCLIWTSGYDAHALVCLGQGSDEHHMLTGNYGAGGMNEAIAPGASLADSPLERDAAGYLHIGGSHRRLHTVITPASIVPYIDAQIDLTGAPVTDDLIDALGARFDHE